MESTTPRATSQRCSRRLAPNRVTIGHSNLSTHHLLRGWLRQVQDCAVFSGVSVTCRIAGRGQMRVRGGGTGRVSPRGPINTGPYVELRGTVADAPPRIAEPPRCEGSFDVS